MTKQLLSPMLQALALPSAEAQLVRQAVACLRAEKAILGLTIPRPPRAAHARCRSTLPMMTAHCTVAMRAPQLCSLLWRSCCALVICFMANKGQHCCIGSNHLGLVPRLCRWPWRGSKRTLPKSIVLAPSRFRTPSRAANHFNRLVCQMRRRMVRQTGQTRTSASHPERSDGSSSSQSGYPQKTAAP